MKKIITVFILAALMLTACSSDKTKENSSTSSSQSSEIISSDTSSESSNTEKEKVKFPSFNAKTIKDEDISSDIFTNYDITMINLWATWCGPCVGEMPELGVMYKNLPENLNLITICLDGAELKDDVVKFMEENKAEMPVIIPNEDIADFLNKNVQGIPTSIFVDKDGNIIGDVITGAPRKDVEKAYRSEFDQRLEMIK